MAYYRLTPEDLMPSDEELDLLKRAQGSQGTGEGIGSLIGSGLGTVAGGIVGTSLFPGLGTAAGAGLGASLGSQLGRLVGGGIGGAVAEGAEGELADIEGRRQEKITAQQMRDEALRRLLETA